MSQAQSSRLLEIKVIHVGSFFHIGCEVRGGLAQVLFRHQLHHKLGGKSLGWDAAALKAKGCPEADVLIQRAYRPGWSLEG